MVLIGILRSDDLHHLARHVHQCVIMLLFPRHNGIV
jgi:hypothetical protein